MLPLILYVSAALMLPTLVPASGASEDTAATVWRADDGLFYVDAMINGAPVRLVVDTGASMTVLSPGDARRVGIDPGSAHIIEVAETAGGARPMARVRLARMQIGRITADGVTAVVAGQSLPFSLLGQDWLSRIGSVTIEGDRLTLR